MPERDLDAVIAVALRMDTFVTAKQKRRAWEQLQKRAAQQTMWPPLIDPEPRSLVESLTLAYLWLRRCAAILLIDEGTYERARKERLAFYTVMAGTSNTTQMLSECSSQNRSQV